MRVCAGIGSARTIFVCSVSTGGTSVIAGDAEPAARVTATTPPEGLVRLEVCQACAALFTEAVLPDEAVDALHRAPLFVS